MPRHAALYGLSRKKQEASSKRQEKRPREASERSLPSIQKAVLFHVKEKSSTVYNTSQLTASKQGWHTSTEIKKITSKAKSKSYNLAPKS